MDLWVWIAILVVAWLLEAVGSAMKKKREPPEDVERMPPPRQRKVYFPDPERLLEIVEEPAEQFVFDVPVARALRPRDAEIPDKPLEGVSAEVVDQAEAGAAESGEPQHRRAAEKYDVAAGMPAVPSAPKRKLVVRPATIREAVLWTEILGKPKGGW